MGSIHAYTLIVVDDDGAYRRTVVEALVSGGYHCVEAGSGTEAVGRLRFGSETVHGLLLDMFLGDMTGADLLTMANREIGHRPCILMSGRTEESVERMARDAGAFTFLKKPFPLDLLRAQVASMFETGEHFA